MKKLVEDSVGIGSAVATGNVDLTVSMPLGKMNKRKMPSDLTVIDEEQKYEYSCCCVTFDKTFSNRILEFAKDILEPEDVIEYEQEPHVTVKYGIKDDSPEALFNLLQNNVRGKFSVFLENIDVFENDEQDVVIIKCQCDRLKYLNQLIKDNLDCEDTFPNYIPHLTLGYVKKGTGNKYKKHYFLEQTNAMIEDIKMLDTSGDVHSFWSWNTNKIS